MPTDAPAARRRCMRARTPRPQGRHGRGSPAIGGHQLIDRLSIGDRSPCVFMLRSPPPPNVGRGILTDRHAERCRHADHSHRDPRRRPHRNESGASHSSSSLSTANKERRLRANGRDFRRIDQGATWAPPGSECWALHCRHPPRQLRLECRAIVFLGLGAGAKIDRPLAAMGTNDDVR